METVFDKLQTRLKSESAEFEVTRHAPVFTSEEAARVRGVALSSGAKALVCKCDDQMVMFVMPADRRLNSKSVRRECGWRKLRFATKEELLEITGLKPGAIPPFGSLFGLPTCCDQRLADHARINFNAGDHEISINLRYDDYVRIEQPRVLQIAE